MSLIYKIFRTPQNIKDLVQYSIKKGIGEIKIETGKELKEDMFAWWVGNVTLACGDKQIKLDKVYISGFSGKFGYCGIECLAQTTNKKTLEEAKKNAKYIESKGLKAIINGEIFKDTN